jgi:SPP1 family predicted phage head-tail adaptor
MIQSGKLRHKISIEQKAIRRDSYGAEEITWTPFLYAWASIEPLSGREYFLAQQIQASVDHKIIMRYQPGIRPDMKAVWNGRSFNIKAVLNKEERNIELMLMCQEFVK